MNCLLCKDLMRVLESASTDYKLARSAPFFLVSTEIAAERLVDMERAKIAVSEHLLYCESVDLAVARSFLSTRNAVPAAALNWRPGSPERRDLQRQPFTERKRFASGRAARPLNLC
jgi:hypothetical protein